MTGRAVPGTRPFQRGARVLEESDPSIRVLASVAVLQGAKVLVMKEEDEPFHKSWVLPQGYPRPGETLSAAARRELAEELGLDVQIVGLLGVYDEFEGNSGPAPVHWVIVCFLGHPVGELEPRPSREAIDYAWVDVGARLPNAPAVTERILTDLGRRRPG